MPIHDNQDDDGGRGAKRQMLGHMTVMGEVWRTAPRCDGCGGAIWGFIKAVTALSKAERVVSEQGHEYLVCHDCIVQRGRDVQKHREGKWYGIGYVRPRHRHREDADE